MTIDLTGIDTKAAFHRLMQRELSFPEWYGVSCDAFRDAIITVVEIPDIMVLRHWGSFAQACSHDTLILQDIIANYPRENPGKQLLLAS